jgi:hypothetical protein
MTVVSYINWSPEQDFNLGTFEYGAEILSTNRNLKPILRPDPSKHNGYQLYVPLNLTLLNSKFCPKGVFLGCLLFSE